MGATKATLIVVGTVVGTGAVLAYSPPHHNPPVGGLGGGGLGGLGHGKTVPTPSNVVPSTPSSVEPTPVASTPAAVKTSTPAPTKTIVPATPQKPRKPVTKKSTAPAAKLANGVFVGNPANAEHGGTVYGVVQVQVTMVNSKITDVQVIQRPSGPISTDLNNQAVPILIQQTLAAVSHVGDITGVSSASATSQGYFDSLTSAISKAGAVALSNAGL